MVGSLVAVDEQRAAVEIEQELPPGPEDTHKDEENVFPRRMMSLFPSILRHHGWSGCGGVEA